MCTTISNDTDTATAIGDLGQLLARVLGENEDEWNVSSALTRIRKLRKCPHNIHFGKEDDGLFGCLEFICYYRLMFLGR